MSCEVHVQFWERAEVKLLRATHLMSDKRIGEHAGCVKR
jgi:hypothetical protein